MGGSMAHEYMVLSPIGEDTLCICPACGYQANRQVATFTKATAQAEEAQPIELVPTPDTTSIADLCAFLDISPDRTAKAVFMTAEGMADETGKSDEKLIFVVIRGDMEVNETKLLNAVKAKSLRPATEVEILAAGAVPGYASPLHIDGALIVVDDAIVTSPNLVGGANMTGYHYRNLNFGRDFTGDIVCDVAAAGEGDACPHCQNPMQTRRGIEVGNIFKLGTRYSAQMGAVYRTADDEIRPIVMGSYGIGLGRLMACVAETHNDEYGLIWPMTITPYQVHLVALGPTDGQSFDVADELYKQMTSSGIEVLYDDRNRSPGVKFNDADLMGMPIRLTVAKRGLSHNSVECKRRDLPDRDAVPLPEVVPVIKSLIADMIAEIEGHVKEVPFTTHSV
ncbi:MAG: YbaK/EbsC family protein, partial [Anaerolineae bacterium]|nr:YbaK/EbsC family protein [Anaerolineae bacterium]